MTDEKKMPNPQDMDTVRFFSLVTMFASSAYQSMGKITSPVTGKIERDLDSARGFIDILIMLKNKTKGNLSDAEEKIITSTISDLQLNFVKEKEKPEPPAEEKAEAEKSGGAESEKKKEEGEKAADESAPIITPPPVEEEEKGEKKEEKAAPESGEKVKEK
ncbi:MAG: DUF1844 domain-containing protein [Candidatus Euphemobacter frigidus]|nr:DUF1844 domain-containing protein [Candidatus Euphemobacter frigidus]MDP8276115.1 DUF1844 domain-containing protein [Candidatus Euphemobacter frigidus]